MPEAHSLEITTGHESRHRGSGESQLIHAQGVSMHIMDQCEHAAHLAVELQDAAHKFAFL